MGKRNGNGKRLAIEGNLLQRNRLNGVGQQLIVVSSFGDGVADDGLARMVDMLFKAYDVRHVRRDEVPDFAKEVESEAA